MNKKSICMVSTYFYPKLGGAEKQFLTLARELSNRGSDVFVVTQKYSKKLPSIEYITGIKVCRLPIINIPILSSISFIISLSIFLLLKSSPYHVMHVNLASSPAVVCALIGMLKRIRVVVKFGGGGEYGDIEVSRRKLLGPLKLFILNKCRVWSVAVSAQIQKELLHERFAKERICIIHNGVDTKLYKRTDQKNKIRKKLNLPDKKILIFSGRLSKVKNIGIILQGMKRATEKFSDLFLLLIGDGPERKNIEELINSLKLNNYAKIMGIVDNAELYYQASDIFILLSISEGLPNSLLEARACGLPAIITDISDSSTIIADGKEGVLVKNTSPDSISDAIQTCLKIGSLPPDINGFLNFNKRYSIESVAQQYENLYNR